MIKYLFKLSINNINKLFKSDRSLVPAVDNQLLQFKGDPAMREFISNRSRIHCPYDSYIDSLLIRIESLLKYYGVFHAKIHFSSGQITLWLLDDPLQYRVYKIEDVIKTDFFSEHTTIKYNDRALDPRYIPAVLKKFKALRLTDDHYLRSGSINLINGLVGLNFSCDGSHYMPYLDFLTETN